MAAEPQRLGDLTRCERCQRVYERTRCADCSELHDTLRFKRHAQIVVEHVMPFCVACAEPIEMFALETRERDVEMGRANN